MLTPPRVVVAAVVGLLLIGGAVLAFQRPDRTNVASPSPSPSVRPSTTPVRPSATPISPSSAPSAAVASAVPTPRSKLIAFETSAFTAHSSTTVRVEREDGSDLHELLPDITSSQLIGRVPDGDQVLVTFRDDERLMALVDLVDGQVHAIPKECPSADCWADSANVYGSGRGGVSLSSDGRQAAMVLSDKAGRSAVIGIVDLATGSTSQIESTRVPIGDLLYGLSDPRLSPDGRTIAYILPDARLDPRKCLGDAVALMVVDRFDGSPPRRLVSSDRCPSDPAWSPSGTDLVFTSNDVTNTPGGSPGQLIAHEHHDVYVVSVKGAKLRRLTTDRMSSQAAWTVDGRISFTVVRDRSALGEGWLLDVWVVDPDTGHRTRLKKSLGALGDAGCRSCAFLWFNDSGSSFPVIGLWP
jgi:WD40-like Beta Propeller Repeat